MSNLTRAMMMGAAGASADKTYVDDVFSTDLWTGVNSQVDVENGIDLSTKGGLVWIKNRSYSSGKSHIIYDTERGANKVLSSNSTNAEVTSIANGTLGINTDGYDIPTGDSDINAYGWGTYVGWTFRKAPGFFDVVTYTGNQTARTISHSLGSVPGMIIIKCTSDGSYWRVYHRSTGATQALELNSTSGANNETYWNSTAPTSSVFSLSTETAVNKTGETYVAYIFAHDDASFGADGNESIIKCGSFTGGNHTESLGFEPQFLLAKKTSGTGDWFLVDNMRGFYPQGADSVNLRPNTTNDENTAWFHLTSDGFYYSSSSATYIYMAIRRPHKPPETATEVFAIDTGNSSSTTPCWDSGFPVDLAIMKKVSVIYPNQLGARLLGTKYLSTNYDNAEANDPDFTFDSNSGWGKTWNNLMYSWMFKRAPGFMDVVAYTGTGNPNHNEPHNLGASPELIIIKNRLQTAEWIIWSNQLTYQHDLKFTSAGQFNGGANYVNLATTTIFRAGSSLETNAVNNNYIAHLFATLSGISKVGSYTGTGNDINIDCGFTSGARFVLIKRTDSNGNWVLFDSLRGIVSGDDPYIKLNTTEAQKTDENHLAPLNAGFTVSSSSEGDTNANGGTYIFLAIA